METRGQIVARLKEAGYQTIHEYDDPTNEVFSDHDHPGDQLLVVLIGSIAINIDEKILF